MLYICDQLVILRRCPVTLSSDLQWFPEVYCLLSMPLSTGAIGSGSSQDHAPDYHRAGHEPPVHATPAACTAHTAEANAQATTAVWHGQLPECCSPAAVAANLPGTSCTKACSSTAAGSRADVAAGSRARCRCSQRGNTSSGISAPGSQLGLGN